MLPVLNLLFKKYLKIIVIKILNRKLLIHTNYLDEILITFNYSKNIYYCNKYYALHLFVKTITAMLFISSN